MPTSCSFRTFDRRQKTPTILKVDNPRATRYAWRGGIFEKKLSSREKDLDYYLRQSSTPPSPITSSFSDFIEPFRRTESKACKKSLVRNVLQVCNMEDGINAFSMYPISLV